MFIKKKRKKKKSKLFLPEFFLEILVELVGGGSVINRAYPVQFYDKVVLLGGGGFVINGDQSSF